MVRFLLSLASARPSSYSDYGDEEEEESESGYRDPISSPLILPGSVERAARGGHYQQHGHPFSILGVMVAALRKSMVLCSVGAGEDDGIDISWPTDVQHVDHVTFDRFGGFLGLPLEFQPELPHRVPSASVSVFGVSAKSMQFSYDSWGNSVPTILLLMQRHLYSQGGLQVEGIFRINAENSQELYVRDQLNRGIVPHGVDMHCLAGLIKAWFRELPTGVLDSLTPDQVMHCNTEEDCFQLTRMLPPTEAALLDWAINLMADIVENERHNKMNARNIAMVFAPNMTQMADPLTALIHAVQVMNFLKTLIIKVLRERIEAAADARVFQSCSESLSSKDGPDSSKPTERPSSENGTDYHIYDIPAFSMSLLSTKHRLGSDTEECFQSFENNEVNEDHGITSGKGGLPINGNLDALGDGSKFDYGNGDAEGILHRLSFRKGVRKLCRHPVFQFSKLTKKSRELGIVSSTDDGREVWA